MPIHFEELDVFSEIAGLRSALIVPCYMCPAVTVAIREKKPFMQLFKGFFKSPPFQKYLKEMQSRLKEKGVDTKVFKSFFYYQWFLCIWTRRRRKKLQRVIKKFDAVIILGCDSATETVRELVNDTDYKVIEGMKTIGITNAKPRLSMPCNIVFEESKVIPISQITQEA